MALPSIASGRWHELIGTKFSQSGLLPSTMTGGGARNGIFQAWTSGAYDSARQRLTMPRGGGHADWAGNQVICFDMQTLQWIMPRPPDPPALTFGSAGYWPMFSNSTDQLLTDSHLLITSDGPDTRTFRVTGFNASNIATTEEITLSGTAIVEGVVNWRYLESFELTSVSTGTTVTVRDQTNRELWVCTPTLALDPRPPGTPVRHFTSAIQGPVSDPMSQDGHSGKETQYWSAIPTVQSDRMPASAHTYDTIEYIPTIDMIYSGGGIYWSLGGDSTPHTVYWWDPRATPALSYTKKSVRPGGVACSVAWDSVAGLLWVRSLSQLHSYNPATDTYTLRQNTPGGGSGGGSSSGVMMCDAANRRLFYIKPLVDINTVQIQTFNITTLTAVTRTDQNISGAKVARPLEPNDSPAGSATNTIEGLGAFWHNDRIVLIGRHPTIAKAMIYTWVPGNPTWTMHDPGDNVLPPAPFKQCHCKKFFTPDGIHAVWVHSEDDNVWAYRMPWASSTGGVPTGVTVSLS